MRKTLTKNENIVSSFVSFISKVSKSENGERKTWKTTVSTLKYNRAQERRVQYLTSPHGAHCVGVPGREDRVEGLK